MDKRNMKIALRIVLSCLFIGYLSFKVDYEKLGRAFQHIDLLLYLLSTLLAVLSNLFVAGKYYLLIKESLIKHSVLSLLKINFISRFYALFLPSAIGPEFVRWYKVTRNQTGRVFFLASIVFERLTFFLVLILFGMMPLFLFNQQPEIAVLRTRLMPIVFLSLAVIFILNLVYILAPFRSFLKSVIDRILRLAWRNLNISSFIEKFSFENWTVSGYIYIFGLSLVWQFFFISRLFILMRAASLPLNFLDIAWIGSLVLLLQTIPISFAGIGIREGAYAYLFTLFKLPSEGGILIGILFFSQMLIMALIGGVLEFSER
jgi:uncharacterized membrane protein YbhN (UPF0104 family)